MTDKQYGQLTPKGQAWIDDQIRTREEGITRIVEARYGIDRFMAMIIHDSEKAEIVTQGKILRTLGFIPKSKTPADADESVVHDRLWDIINGLAFLNTYLTSTNHLSDRELLDRLESKILKEPIRFIPPTRDMNEFIDMNPNCIDGFVTDRDSELLPLCSHVKDAHDLALFHGPADHTSN